MSELERLARAMCVADGQDPDEDWRLVDQPGGGQVMCDVAVDNPARWTTYVRPVRAVLKALREPTTEALDAGQIEFLGVKIIQDTDLPPNVVRLVTPPTPGQMGRITMFLVQDGQIIDRRDAGPVPNEKDPTPN